MKPGHGWSNLHKKTELNASYCLLCTTENLPDWHFAHRGVKFGYRSCDTFYSAFNSLFYWHNETINIWSHYLTALLLVFHVDYRFDLFGITLLTPMWTDSVILIVGIFFGNIIPIFLSAFCHQFYCVSKSWHILCWYLDFVGILSGMLFDSLTFMYITLYCYPNICGYIATISIVGYFLALTICWKWYRFRMSESRLQPKDRFPEFSKILSAFGVLETLLTIGTSLYTNQEYRNDHRFRHILMLTATGPLIMGLGIVLFAQGNIPERFTPQLNLPKHTFDYIGHSHQWWHLVSAGLMFAWVECTYAHYKLRLSHGQCW